LPKAGDAAVKEMQEKTAKTVDKKFRAFSYSIDASKLFELAIRKPRNKMKHRFSAVKSFLYGLHLLFINHHGSPTYNKDLNGYFLLYSVVLALDITVLINFCFHCFLNAENFSSFGWVFCFILAGVPFYAPLCAMVSAFTGSESMLRLTGNMNSMSICFNYPLTMFAMAVNGDDAEYLVMLTFMLLVKVILSAIAAKIRAYLQNPRFGQNDIAVRKMMARQASKRHAQAEILGANTVQ